jgi:YhcH/YjgK/YiaL family protein
MVIGNLTESAKYATLSPAIAEALGWLRANIDKPGFEDGKSINLADGNIIVNCQEVDLKPTEGCLLEAHREWVDIQVAIDTPEQIGWAPVAACSHVAKPYQGDAEFYSDSPQCLVPVLPGQFMILYPEDAHAPNIGSGRHRKYVVKVRVGK